MTTTILASDFEDLSQRSAALVLDQLNRKPTSLFVFPTGATPLGLFKALGAAKHVGKADFSRAAFAVLDEYAGLAAGDRRSLTDWLRRELLAPLGTDPDQLLAFNSMGDAIEEGRRMERAISDRGGIDLAILGLGPNGHLGFNEPGTAFDARSGLVPLSPASITSNAAYWGSEADVPRTGFTLGLGTLAEARRFLLIVSGAHKADILARVLASPASTDLPATMVHRHAEGKVIADRLAAARHIKA